MTRFTVLGASGYVGRHLVARLQAQGHACWAPERDDEQVYRRDLGVVFYCIGLTADFRTRPFDTVQAHVGVLQRVLAQARFDRLVYLSSTRVYLGAPDTAEDQLLVVSPSAPDDLYKLSKLMGESLALNAGRDCVVARLSNVVGGDRGNADSFVYQLLREAQTGQVELHSLPESAKDYIHMDDLLDLLQCLAAPCQHRIFNLASGVQITHRQWLEALANGSGCAWRVNASAVAQHWPPIRVERARAAFALRPRGASRLIHDTLQAHAHSPARL